MPTNSSASSCVALVYMKTRQLLHLSGVDAAMGLVLPWQSLLSNTSSPFSGFPEKMTVFSALGWGRERESKNLTLGFLCQPLAGDPRHAHSSD